jgi:Predicted metal-binding integral membrane protein (DUF2182)
MNVLWIALLALLVLLEKLTPWGRWGARAAGVACVAAGVWMVSSAPAGKAGPLWGGPSLRQNIHLSVRHLFLPADPPMRAVARSSAPL